MRIGYICGMKRKILIGIVIVFAILQFFRIDYSQPESMIENDFIVMTNPPEGVANTLRTSCYDCHSNQTNYPWYSQIAPVSWWVGDHIHEGREELNFSEWGTFSEKRKAKKLHEIEEEVEEGEMPLESYLIMHSESKLSEEQREELEAWIKYVASKP